jgi:sterol desaturase/sphingolipid hydroxylase (fatty acid hydroxylase superfamily)
MDRYRLVFPVIGGYLVYYFVFWLPLKALIPDLYLDALMAGSIIGYVSYDLIHYMLHHSSPKLKYFRDLKTHHMQHHYKNGTEGFGVSSKFWDHVFLTTIK